MDVSVTSSLFGAGGSSQVDATSGVIGGGVVGDEFEGEDTLANIANGWLHNQRNFCTGIASTRR